MVFSITTPCSSTSALHQWKWMFFTENVTTFDSISNMGNRRTGEVSCPQAHRAESESRVPAHGECIYL